jgi:sec-independent protein translocase protein TatB
MEALLIIIIALIVVGPAKLPEVMGQVGKAIGDFRRATSDLSDEFNKTIQAELSETRSVLEETKAAVSDVHTTVNSAVTGAPATARVSAPSEPQPAPNGTSAAAAATGANGDGLLPEAPVPLAETTTWSWETSAPATPPAEDSTAASANGASESAGGEENPTPDVAPAGEAATSESSSSGERATRDELLPPY